MNKFKNWPQIIELRPFRTSAIIFGVLLIVALNLVLNIVETGNPYADGLIDGTLIGIAFTALATAIAKLSDDGGESDAVTITRMFLENKKNE